MDTWGLGEGPTIVWFAPQVSWFWCWPAKCLGFSGGPPRVLDLA